MILYVTDGDGNQYRADVDSEVYSIEDSRFTDSPTAQKIVYTNVLHTVRVTKLVAEFTLTSTPGDDPALLLNDLYSAIEERI